MCGECGKKTGCLITADGSEDEKIQLESLKEYKVQLPMPMKPAQAPPISNYVDPMDEENETNVMKWSSTTRRWYVWGQQTGSRVKWGSCREESKGFIWKRMVHWVYQILQYSSLGVQIGIPW